MRARQGDERQVERLRARAPDRRSRLLRVRTRPAPELRAGTIELGELLDALLARRARARSSGSSRRAPRGSAPRPSGRPPATASASVRRAASRAPSSCVAALLERDRGAQARRRVRRSPSSYSRSPSPGRRISVQVALVERPARELAGVEVARIEIAGAAARARARGVFAARSRRRSSAPRAQPGAQRLEPVREPRAERLRGLDQARDPARRRRCARAAAPRRGRSARCARSGSRPRRVGRARAAEPSVCQISICARSSGCASTRPDRGRRDLVERRRERLARLPGIDRIGRSRRADKRSRAAAVELERHAPQ